MIEAAAPVLRSNQQRFAVRWARPTTRRSRAAPGATGGQRDIYYLQTITTVRARLAEIGTLCAAELVERGNALEANRTFLLTHFLRGTAMTQLRIDDLSNSQGLSHEAATEIRGGRVKLPFQNPAVLNDNTMTIDEAANAGDDSHFYGLPPLR